MDARLTLEIAKSKAADMRRVASNRPAGAAPKRAVAEPTAESEAVTIRLASPVDAGALDRLAGLDSARPPIGPTLLAERDGELVAALPLRFGRPLADPFRPTAELVRLLELRAAQLEQERQPRRRPGSWLRRPRAALGTASRTDGRAATEPR